jgi:hypothetical protein
MLKFMKIVLEIIDITSKFVMFLCLYMCVNVCVCVGVFVCVL